jgi:lipoprotein-releasing system ATP-binding protein
MSDQKPEQVISARGLRKTYGTLEVLRGVDLDVQRGEIVAIVGASGAGKSTLLHILGTLDRPDSGELHISGQAVRAMNKKALDNLRNHRIGFVFQAHHLLPEFNAVENVLIPGLIAGKPETELLARAETLLSELGLSKRFKHRPAQLSGGEQQRVAVARALFNQPDVILADEPSGNLDSDNSRELHRIFLSLRDRYHQTFIIVTHNPELAAMADRTLRMADGRILNS